jgi:DNA replication protein DnaC
MDIANNIFDALVRRSSQTMPMSDGDYIGEDGLVYCGKCHTRKQTRVTLPDGREITPMCMCDCEVKSKEREEAEERKRERMQRIGRYRSAGFQDSELAKCTFDKDDGASAAASLVARNYAKNFRDFRRAGKGLMFYGPVGTGKTFIASCIANALIDQCIPCLVTNFSRIVNTLQSTYEGKQQFMNDLNDYDMLVIDDFAMERNTEYVNEIVYNVIDSRYRAGKPLIVTTNVPISEFNAPQDLSKQRIYSRIAEMCVSVEVSGKDRRKGSSDADLIAKLFM